ncbi:MAG: nitronate monooxygenase [Gemmatimonadaceae bacterium]|nr:nitronate monooxygenase [Gemmatimonadaceae bacterium]
MPEASALPQIIQGGMGVAVSNWKLARAVSTRGQLGVVSGTVLDTVFVRRLQDGDIGGHLRRAMKNFPIPGVADAALHRYFHPAGRAPGERYKLLQMYKLPVSIARQQLTMLANFVEVYLAKEGHSGKVGINLLTKVQLPNLASLYGAMLAKVDCVLMGAGIPREVPGVLDALAEHRPAAMKLEVEGLAADEPMSMTLDPRECGVDPGVSVERPAFLPIVSANSLATTLARKANGTVEGFVVEGPTAGGHNAPPRGEPRYNERGEPLYGERDEVNMEKMRELGLPFWLAGGAGSPQHLVDALKVGAAGVQVGTLFAFCEESGLEPGLKQEILDYAARGEVDIITDPRASPTGYPFKVARWGKDSGGPERMRLCDLGYLRVAYKRDDGRIGFRCAAEPVDDYVRKGGAIEDTVGRQCLCNALTANIGQAQLRVSGEEEPPLVTSGDDLKTIANFLDGRRSYSAGDVIDYLLSWIAAPRHLAPVG